MTRTSGNAIFLVGVRTLGLAEGYGGELQECPDGKGYDLVLLDVQGA